jgi:transmembrane sensor
MMGNMAAEEGIRAQAIAWRIQLADGDAAAWERFVDWLEQSPEHGRAYDLVALAEQDAVSALAVPAALPAPANDQTPRPGRRAWVGLSAAAAAVALAVVGAPMLQSGAYEVRTRPGEQRQIALTDGTRITLNGATRIELDRSRPRVAKLESGEAHFAVVHDPGAPFRVQLGEAVVQDVGTVFNVVRDRTGNRVEVAEGAVRYNPDRENVSLTAGQTLLDPVGDDPVRVGRRAPSAIGGWTSGRLSYQEESLDRVAAELSRMVGVPIAVAPGLAERSFSGTIRIGHDRKRVVERAAALLDVSARRTGSGWILEPRAREVR